MNRSEWIEEYKTEDGLEYRIPEYKIHRIIRQYRTLAVVEKTIEELINNNTSQGTTHLILKALLNEIKDSR